MIQEWPFIHAGKISGTPVTAWVQSTQAPLSYGATSTPEDTPQPHSRASGPRYLPSRPPELVQRGGPADDGRERTRWLP